MEQQEMLAKAHALMEEGAPVSAVNVLKQAAELGNAVAQYELGNCYYAGIGVAEEIEQAFRYYTLAAEHGHADAANNLADMYLNGEATAVDEARALQWFTFAAQRGVVEASFTLGIMHEQGLGVRCDEARAYAYYKESADGGYSEAQYRLGMIHLDGLLGRLVDESLAITWFERAGTQFHIDALFNLGYLYEQTGQGAKAVHYYKQAALQGDVDAKYQLANLYMQGRLVQRDEKEARKWEQAAEMLFDE